MDTTSVQRAVTCGAVWGATALVLTMVTGIDQSWTDIATDAGGMAASAAASDIAHNALGISLISNDITSAVGAGLFYALFQKILRGDDSYLANAGFAAANDYAVTTIGIRV